MKNIYGDIITLDGWEIENYLKNPVILANHNYLLEAIQNSEKNEFHNTPRKEYSKKKQEIINACQKEPEREEVYFYVFVPGTGEPKVKHSFQSAKIEAFRISQKEWKEAIILQALKSYKPSGIIETNFMHEPKKNDRNTRRAYRTSQK